MQFLLETLLYNEIIEPNKVTSLFVKEGENYKCIFKGL